MGRKLKLKSGEVRWATLRYASNEGWSKIRLCVALYTGAISEALLAAEVAPNGDRYCIGELSEWSEPFIDPRPRKKD